jgi:hypothetical protein
MPPYVAGPHPWSDKFVSRHLSDGFGQLPFGHGDPLANQLDRFFLNGFVCKEIPHDSRFSLGIETCDPNVPSCWHCTVERFGFAQRALPKRISSTHLSHRALHHKTGSLTLWSLPCSVSSWGSNRVGADSASITYRLEKKLSTSMPAPVTRTTFLESSLSLQRQPASAIVSW